MKTSAYTITCAGDKFEITLNNQGHLIQVDTFKRIRGSIPFQRRNIYRPGKTPADQIEYHFGKLSLQMAVIEAKKRHIRSNQALAA